MRGVGVVLLSVAGCYQPTFPNCLIRCSEARECPAGRQCADDGFCHGDQGEDSCAGADAAPPADAAADARWFDAGPCEAAGNESPATPMAITTGAYCVAFAGDGSAFASSCGTGGRDLFFQLDLPSAQVVYADTFGSTGPTTLSAWNGACGPSPPSTPTCFPDGTCGQAGALAAASLGPGLACLAVEELGSAGGSGDAIVHLNVIQSGTDGIEAIASTTTIDTCTQISDFPAGACAGSGPEGRWYIPMCPTGISLSVYTSCSPSGRAVNLLARLTVAHDSPDLGCNMGVCGTSPPSMGLGSGAGGLVWFIMDGPNTGDCGPTSLSVTF